jgi:2-polyprenyl-3-methyl-5-hydroxy-6-metoxy-1,4-benzoquinol methylase
MRDINLTKIVKDYLKYLKIKKKVFYKIRSCEICGSKKNTIIQEKISWNRSKYGTFPVVACNFCGFLFQLIKFSKKFYNDFYSEYYRKIIFSNKTPSKEFLQDQEYRGKKLYNFVKKFFKRKGSILDVGSSVGLMLLPFKKKGWQIHGNDPDTPFVKYAVSKLKLPIDLCQAEDMKYDKKFDLIIIMGSLEHCYDPNIVLKKCAKYSKKNSILVLEGRGDPLGKISDFFNHNHHRYFNGNSLELMMIKHGWTPFLTTQYPIYGPTRLPGYSAYGRFSSKKPNIKSFKKIIKNGKKETVESVKYRFKYFEYINKNR